MCKLLWQSNVRRTGPWPGNIKPHPHMYYTVAKLNAVELLMSRRNKTLDFGPRQGRLFAENKLNIQAGERILLNAWLLH